jgi:hypothetical protein
MGMAKSSSSGGGVDASVSCQSGKDDSGVKEADFGRRGNETHRE